MNSEPDVSVIIPIGPGEAIDAPLLQRLHLIPDRWSILLACCEASASLGRELCRLDERLELVIAPQGRAKQMNLAVAQSNRCWLWFLHVDSQLETAHVEQVQAVVAQSRKHLYCFPLTFVADGPKGMWLNGWGANMRTRWLGVPFGDQGFLLERELFDQAGGYNEGVDYGEDHLLVWQLRCRDVSAQMLSPPLGTSARRYKCRGWFALTVLYQWRWLKQAAPWVWIRLRQWGNSLFSWKQSSP